MQRVLSIQTARGFGESSEFVTKRSCISFLFAIGFLSLLGGFMLGRMAVQRTITTRAERTRLEFAENGLQATEHLQYHILESLQGSNFPPKISGDLTETKKKIFSEFNLIKEVFKLKSCTVGRAEGSREPDRYVMVSLNSNELEVLNNLIKSLNKIHTSQDWNPRRSLLFCICEKSSNECFHELSNYLQSKVVAFITQADDNVKNLNLLPVENCLLVSGSNIAGTAVQKSVNFLKNLDSKSINLCDNRQFLSSLNFNVPQAVLSFVDKKQNNSLAIEDNLFVKSRKIIAQVIALSVWRLSESIILPWSENTFNETISRFMTNFESSRLFENEDFEKVDLDVFRNKITSYLENINSLEIANILNVRIANDLLLDLEKTFLCLENQPLQRLRDCYKSLIRISQI